ncbi:MAG: DUF5615 family PIN-like protein [Blastocatellia bacterium]
MSILARLYPESDHVFTAGLDTSSDADVREFAARNDFVIVTKDADFAEMDSLLGAPPSIVWIRRGNCPTNAIEAMLRHHVELLHALIDSDSSDILTIY